MIPFVGKRKPRLRRAVSLPLESIVSKSWGPDWGPGPLAPKHRCGQVSEKNDKENLGPDSGGQQGPNRAVWLAE